MIADNLMNIILIYKKIKTHIPTEKQIKLVSNNLLVDIIISDGLLFGFIRIHIVLDFVLYPDHACTSKSRRNRILCLHLI